MAIATAERARRVGQDIRPEEALPYHYPWFRQMKDCSQSVYPEVIAALHEWGIDPDLHRITIQETGYLDLLREHSAHRAEDSDAIESPSSGTSQADHPQPDHFPSQNAGALGQDSGDLPEGAEPTGYARDECRGHSLGSSSMLTHGLFRSRQRDRLHPIMGRLVDRLRRYH
jgi:hypothetical protein